MKGGFKRALTTQENTLQFDQIQLWRSMMDGCSFPPPKPSSLSETSCRLPNPAPQPGAPAACQTLPGTSLGAVRPLPHWAGMLSVPRQHRASLPSFPPLDTGEHVGITESNTWSLSTHFRGWEGFFKNPRYIHVHNIHVPHPKIKEANIPNF